MRQKETITIMKTTKKNNKKKKPKRRRNRRRIRKKKIGKKNKKIKIETEVRMRQIMRIMTLQVKVISMS